MFDTEKFIGEIEKRPAIYDIQSKFYSNRVAKLKYWHEVGKEMYKGWDNFDQHERRTLIKELQIKWKSIRDHFMRQLKQNLSGEGPKKKKYVYFDQLQFLTTNLGVKRPRNSYRLLRPDMDDYLNANAEEPTPSANATPYRVSVERPSIDSNHDLNVDESTSDLSSMKEFDGDRMGNRMFLLSLVPVMDQLTDFVNIRVRLQLMQVLQDALASQDASHLQTKYYYEFASNMKRCGDELFNYDNPSRSPASHSDSDE